MIERRRIIFASHRSNASLTNSNFRDSLVLVVDLVVVGLVQFDFVSFMWLQLVVSCRWIRSCLAFGLRVELAPAFVSNKAHDDDGDSVITLLVVLVG